MCLAGVVKLLDFQVRRVSSSAAAAAAAVQPFGHQLLTASPCCVNTQEDLTMGIIAPKPL